MAGIQVARVTETLRQHRPQADRPRLCVCGYSLEAPDTMDDHRARAIVSRLFGNINKDLEQPPNIAHRGHPDNIAMHRALKEPLCLACSTWLDSREG